jgi:uncharacterized RDD family membrane protein YckC
MKIKCPACSKVLNIPDSATGKVLKCPCGKKLKAPAASSPAAATSLAAKTVPAARRPATSGSTGPSNFDGDGFFDELTETDLQPVKAVNMPGRAEVRDRSAGAKLLDQYSPGSGGVAAAGSQRLSDMTLASPGTRIAAVLLDGLMYAVIIGGGFGIGTAILAFFGGEVDAEPSAGAFLAFNIVTWGCIAVAYLINIVLISKSGQSVGKKMLKIKMVNSQTGVTASFSDGWFTRSVVFGFLAGLPLIGIFIAITDIVFLFKEGHETLHDKLAKTMVVQALR